MMSFSTAEVLFSIIYSIAYGALFFLFYTATCIIKNELLTLKALPSNIIRYDKILQKSTKNQGRNQQESGALGVSLSIILFSLGLVFLFYYALDGCVRVYAFLTSLGAFFALKSLLFRRCVAIFSAIFDFSIFLITVGMRIAIFPFLRLFLYFKSKNGHFLHIFNKNNI